MRAVIVAARRTAVMPHGGAFAAHLPHDLAAPVIRALLADAGLEAGQVDEVILANALGAGGNPARLAALAAGLPDRVAGLSLDRQCAGGLDAVALAAALVGSGQAQAVIAGGAESWSRRPLRLAQAPGRAPEAYDAPPFTPWPDRDPDMAEAADRLAVSRGITRAAQEAFAVASHAKARAAPPMPEIVALSGITSDGFTRHLTDRMAARAPVVHGSITAATMAVAADGAAFVLVVSEAVAGRLRPALAPVPIRAALTLGSQPDQPALSAIAPLKAALRQAGLASSDLWATEIMEAFAVQAMVTVADCGLDPDRFNRGGGALARGHPIGASGAVLAVRLVHELQRGSAGCGTGAAAIAAAGGIGSALVLG